MDLKVLVKSEQWSANQLQVFPHAELNSCWDFHWTPFRSVWLLSLPSMLFELELTSALLWALLLLIRPVLKVNTSIYKRKVPSVHHPKSKYTLRVFRANPCLATQSSKTCSAITQTSTIICCLNDNGAQAHRIIIFSSWHYVFFICLERSLQGSAPALRLRTED